MVSTLGGLQMIAILGAEDAPDRIEFALDLPKGTELIQQPDGSIAIFAEVETRSVPDSEARRVTAAAEAVLGRDFDENTVITDRQWERLAAIPEAETVVASQLQEIGSVAAPWAVDSVGRSLPTHYEVTGGSLTQVVVTDLNTAFPVTADPTWVWWVGTTALCVVDLGTYVLPGGAAAKVAKGITKIKSAMTKSAALKKAVDKLGGMQKALKTALQYMKDKSRLSKANQAYVQQLFKGGGKLLFDAIGLGSCYALVMEGK
jgi:hypothetical protein